MPYKDRTGPMGRGPLTGRGMGPCGKGRMMMGRGFGRRACIMTETYEPVQLTKEEQKKILEAELNYMEEERKEIEKKLKEMK